MEKLLLTAVAALALTINVASAQTMPKLSPEATENVENMPAILAMAEYVKQQPTQQRDKWMESAAAALAYNQHCERLPLKVRIAMLGITFSDAANYTAHSKKIDALRELTADFCVKFKPAIESLNRTFEH
jgi:hypothetical protein